jgi:hypothetical protein
MKNWIDTANIGPAFWCWFLGHVWCYADGPYAGDRECVRCWKSQKCREDLGWEAR